MQVKVVLKLAVLGVLSVFLLIALSAIGGLTFERKSRQSEVQQNIAERYAGKQRIAGPVIMLTYRERWTGKLYNEEKNVWYTSELKKDSTELIYPEQLQYSGSLDVQERYRGIFKANVFQSRGQLAGSVKFPEESTLRTEKNSEIEVLGAVAFVLVSDARGISKTPVLNWKGNPLEIKPGSLVDKDYSGVHAVLPDAEHVLGQVHPFSMSLDVHGMGLFEIVPIAADNQIMMESSWPHPSFVGDFLATKRTVSEEGFSAEWNVNSLACSAQRDLNSDHYSRVQTLGVSLIDPVNVYPMTDRALKYGFLFIFITFAAFFLFELVKQLKIHPVQYGFVGLAQAIFFLLLLSLSEHIGFGVSYMIASAATIVVIALYLCSVLKGLTRGLLFGGVLVLLYGALFGLLQSEDHALVAGSSLLFGLLAVVMLLTRNVDWYALSVKAEDSVQ